jgi:hypothetical protein
MPLYLDSTTDVIAEYPENIGRHPVLGRYLTLYTPGDECFEEDKVVVDAASSTQRLKLTAKHIDAPSQDQDTHE